MSDDMKHLMIVGLIGILVLLFSASEYRLYKEQAQLKAMVSEGLMQLKEEMHATVTPTVSPTSRQAKPPMKY